MLAIRIPKLKKSARCFPLESMIKRLFQLFSKKKSDRAKISDLRPIASQMTQTEYQEFRKFSKAWLKGKASLWK